MKLISGANDSLPKELYTRLVRYRHKVFVEHLGWPLCTDGDMEVDEFDRKDTLYVIAQNENNDIQGCARLLPTTTPYLLSEKFPHLLNGMAPPCAPDIWELSRFAAVDFSHANQKRDHKNQAPPLAQFSARAAVSLLHAVIATASERGITRLITVSPLGIERLLRNAGFRAHRAGPPQIIDGNPVFACWIGC